MKTKITIYRGEKEIDLEVNLDIDSENCISDYLAKDAENQHFVLTDAELTDAFSKAAEELSYEQADLKVDSFLDCNSQ